MTADQNWGSDGHPSLAAKAANGSAQANDVLKNAANDTTENLISRATRKISRVDQRTRLTSVEERQSFSAADSSGDVVAYAGAVLAGNIKSCGSLTVEGEVKAKLKAKQIVIAKGGIFRGDAEVDEAEIAGLFEGALCVSGRLVIRRSGRLRGHAAYGELEIEPGGELRGRVMVTFAGQKVGLFSRAPLLRSRF